MPGYDRDGMCIDHGMFSPTCGICPPRGEEESRVRVRKITPPKPIPYIEDIVGIGGDESLPTEEEEEDGDYDGDYKDRRDPAEAAFASRPPKPTGVPPAWDLREDASATPLVTKVRKPRTPVPPPQVKRVRPLRVRRAKELGKCTECNKEKVIVALGLCWSCYQRQRRARTPTRPA